jgi:hypothetical protein
MVRMMELCGLMWIQRDLEVGGVFKEGELGVVH